MSRLVATALAAALLVLHGTLAIAQDQELRISASFSNATIEEILTAIGEQYPVRFYYNSDQLPTDRVDKTFENLTLTESMDELLRNTLLGYIDYRDYAVLIAPRYLVDQDFGSDYYQALETSIDAPETQEDTRIVVGDIAQLDASGVTSLRGTILDAENAEPIIGANVTVPNLGRGTVTDANGVFEIELPVGEHALVVRYIGYGTLVRDIQIFSDGDIQLDMESTSVELEEVTVRADAPDASVEKGQISVATLDMNTIKQLPTFLGETDVVRSILLMPGVSTIGEGATGFNVRGGEVDQNLIMQDEGIFMNSSHALGFYSAFNADLIGRVDLYKGNMPAEYGGRLASVMDIEMRDGNYSDWKIKGGLGPVASRLTVEGPLVKDRVAFIAGGRVSHADWVLRRINVPEVENSSAFFYDAQARLSIRMTDKHSLILSGYGSNDRFDFNQEFGFEYQTYMAQATYKAIFSDAWYSNLTASASRYESTQFSYQGEDASKFLTGVDQLKIKEKLTFQPNRDLRVDAGGSIIWYRVNPGEQDPLNESSTTIPGVLEQEQSNELALFLNAEYSPSARLLINAGLRYVMYAYTGPKTIFEYANPDAPLEREIIDSTFYASGRIETYSSIEPRLSLRYKFTESASIKIGYSRTAQFINQIFNSDTPTPTSQWQLSTPYVEPTRSHNLSAGFFKNFNENTWETSVEIYGRSIDYLYDYRDFADLIMNPHIETELLDGTGRTYGAELSVKKRQGEVNGWVSYTLSRSERQIEGINQGDWYPSNFDQTHVMSFVFNWQPNRRNTLTVNFNYRTGRPTTPPLGSYETTTGVTIPVYSERNAQRIPDYHRLDIAYTIGQGYKKDRKFRTSWTFSVYNLYARQNPFSVFYTREAFGRTQANQLSILGTAFPAVTFNFEFL